MSCASIESVLTAAGKMGSAPDIEVAHASI